MIISFEGLTYTTARANQCETRGSVGRRVLTIERLSGVQGIAQAVVFNFIVLHPGQGYCRRPRWASDICGRVRPHDDRHAVFLPVAYKIGTKKIRQALSASPRRSPSADRIVWRTA